MQVQIIHQKSEGDRTELGVRELAHMPPIGEPFPIDEQTCYTTKAYFGPDENGSYVLVLEGEPLPMTTGKM